ncbi:hypothetical protein EJB05_16249, partial [Eragrostis curvula]
MMRRSGGSWLASPSPTMCSAQHPPGAALQEDRGEGIQGQEQAGRVSQEGIGSVTIRNDEELRRLQAGITIAHDVFYPTSTRVLVSKITMEKASIGGSKEVESPKKA